MKSVAICDRGSCGVCMGRSLLPDRVQGTFRELMCTENAGLSCKLSLCLTFATVAL